MDRIGSWIFTALLVIVLSVSFSPFANGQDLNLSRDRATMADCCWQTLFKITSAVSHSCLVSKQRTILVLLLSLSTLAVADNVTNCSESVNVLSQCQVELELCLANNTNLLSEIVEYTRPVPGIDPFSVYVYTLAGAWVSLAGVIITLICDPYSSWYFTKKSQDHSDAKLIETEQRLKEKMTILEDAIVDEIRRNRDDNKQDILARYRTLLATMLTTVDNTLEEDEAQQMIDNCLAADDDEHARRLLLRLTTNLPATKTRRSKKSRNRRRASLSSISWSDQDSAQY